MIKEFRFLGPSAVKYTANPNLYDELEELTIIELNKIVNTRPAEWIRENCCIITNDGQAKYIMDVQLGKLYIGYFERWFKNKFPDVLSERSKPNAEKLNSYVYQMIFQLFLLDVEAKVDVTNVNFPYNYGMFISTDKLKESSFAKTIHNKACRNLPKVIKNLIKAPAVTEPVKKKIAYDANVITDIGLRQALENHVKVSWPVFFSCFDLFRCGCDIVLGLDEVVLDSDGNVLLYNPDLYEIIYHGPEFRIAHKRNTLEIIWSAEVINTKSAQLISEYFKENFGITSIRFLTRSYKIVKNKKKNETTTEVRNVVHHFNFGVGTGLTPTGDKD